MLRVVEPLRDLRGSRPRTLAGEPDAQPVVARAQHGDGKASSPCRRWHRPQDHPSFCRLTPLARTDWSARYERLPFQDRIESTWPPSGPRQGLVELDGAQEHARPLRVRDRGRCGDRRRGQQDRAANHAASAADPSRLTICLPQQKVALHSRVCKRSRVDTAAGGGQPPIAPDSAKTGGSPRLRAELSGSGGAGYYHMRCHLRELMGRAYDQIPLKP